MLVPSIVRKFLAHVSLGTEGFAPAYVVVVRRTSFDGDGETAIVGYLITRKVSNIFIHTEVIHHTKQLSTDECEGDKKVKHVHNDVQNLLQTCLRNILQVRYLQVDNPEHHEWTRYSYEGHYEIVGYISLVKHVCHLTYLEDDGDGDASHHEKFKQSSSRPEVLLFVVEHTVKSHLKRHLCQQDACHAQVQEDCYISEKVVIPEGLWGVHAH